MRSALAPLGCGSPDHETIKRICTKRLSFMRSNARISVAASSPRDGARHVGMLLFLWSWNGPVANATAGTSIVPIPWEHLLGFAGLWLAINGVCPPRSSRNNNTARHPQHVAFAVHEHRDRMDVGLKCFAAKLARRCSRLTRPVTIKCQKALRFLAPRFHRG